MAGEYICELHQFLADACIVHDRSSHHKEGNGKKRKGLGAGDKLLEDQVNGAAGIDYRKVEE
jgi:hypothetical protein